MIDPAKFQTESLSHSPLGKSICSVLASALGAVDPYECIVKHLKRQGDTIFFGTHQRSLSKYRNIYIIGAGKAGYPMAAATANILGKYFTCGCVIVKEGHKGVNTDVNLPTELVIIEAGHPIPDIRGIYGTQYIINILSKTTENDLVICLISGGGSSLLCLPAPTLTLSDIQQTTSLLLSSGAPIGYINVVRKHIDMVKGGQLARAAYPAEMIALILSDVVGDSLESIASGPTVPDPSTYKQAMLILQQYVLVDQVPNTIIEHIMNGIAGISDETPKSDDISFRKVHNIVVGSNHLAIRASLKQARLEGFKASILTTCIEGEAQEVGKVLAAIARTAAEKHSPASKPVCMIIGGETTVNVKGTGQGGRNQELALATVTGMANLGRTFIITLATDGGDGLTDAAGAVVTGSTYDRAVKLHLNPQNYLRNNDSYNFFLPLNDLIKIGPTQTNVNDIAIIINY